MSERVRRVRVVDALPEIVEHLDPSEHEVARRYLVADLWTVRTGNWVPTISFQRLPGHLGLLILDGLLARDVIMEKALATELVGRGDLLRPADRDEQDPPIPFDIAWRVLRPARIAVLDAAFTRIAGHWPSVVEFFIRGASNRAHSLAISLAISHLRHVDTRLEALMWYLADRWGKVRPDGVVVPLKLTHETLARLVGAQRPSVTTALRRLAEDGRMTRTPERYWLLQGDPPTSVSRHRSAETLLAGAVRGIDSDAEAR